MLYLLERAMKIPVSHEFERILVLRMLRCPALVDGKLDLKVTNRLICGSNLFLGCTPGIFEAARQLDVLTNIGSMMRSSDKCNPSRA